MIQGKDKEVIPQNEYEQMLKTVTQGQQKLKRHKRNLDNTLATLRSTHFM